MKTERFSTETQQKETAAFMEADEAAEKGVALSAKLLTADRVADAAAPVIPENSDDGRLIPLAADKVAVAAVPVSAENSDDGRLTPFVVSDQILGDREEDEAGIEKGFSFEKDVDARWFAFSRQNDFGESTPNRRPLARVVENQEAVTGPSASASELSLPASSVDVRDGKTSRLPVDDATGRFAPREPVPFAVDSKSVSVDAVSGSFRGAPLTGSEESDRRTPTASFATASSMNVRDGKMSGLPVEDPTGRFAPSEPISFAVDSKSGSVDAVSGSFRGASLTASEESDGRTPTASYTTASSMNARDGKTSRLPVDDATGRFAPREPVPFAVDSKSVSVDAVSGSFRGAPLTGSEESDRRTPTASFATASSMNVRDGKMSGLPVEDPMGRFSPSEPISFAVDSKSGSVDAVSGSFRGAPLTGSEESDGRTPTASYARASSMNVRDGKMSGLPVGDPTGRFSPSEPISFAVDSKSVSVDAVSGSFRDLASPATREENAKPPVATFSLPDSETSVGIFTAKNDGASSRNELMNSRRFSEKDTIVGRRFYDFSRKQGEADVPFADEGSFAARKGHEMDVKLSDSFVPLPGREETGTDVRDALDRRNADMVNNSRADRVLPKGADETIPSAVYEGRAAVIDVSLQKKLDGESLLRDAENRFSFADRDALENIRSTILKEAVSPSSKAQKEKSLLPGDEFSARIPGNGAADIQTTASGRQVFSVDDSSSLESRTIAEQVMSQIPEDAFKSANRVRINLYPESLGKLDMEIVVRENRVQVFIVADRTDVAQALHGQQDQLKNALQSQGLQVGSLDFQWRENPTAMGDGSGGRNLWRHQYQESGSSDGGNDEAPVIAARLGALAEKTLPIQAGERTISLFV